MEKLENQVNELALQENVDLNTWLRFTEVLMELKLHNPRMYAHSLRVGIYAHGLAEFEGEHDLKFPLFAGCGHDIGKCQVSNIYLDSQALTKAEFEHIKIHAEKGYQALKDDFLYTALVAGLHHCFQKEAYGIRLREVAPAEMPESQLERIQAMAQLVSICDFFDALTTRGNEKGFLEDPNDPNRRRQVMEAFFPTFPDRTNWLLANQIEKPLYG